MYDCYFTNVLTKRSCFEVLLTADSHYFTRDDARTFVPTISIPRRRRAFVRDVLQNENCFVKARGRGAKKMAHVREYPHESSCGRPSSFRDRTFVR